MSHRDLPSAFICALVHRRERTRGCRWCFPTSVSVAENCGNCQLLLQSRTFLRRCRGKPGLEPRRSARRVMSSGTVEAADACSESSTELSSIGPSEMSDCNGPRLAPQQSSLLRARRSCGRSDCVVTFGRSHVALPCGRGPILRFADLCSARL